MKHIIIFFAVTCLWYTVAGQDKVLMPISHRDKIDKVIISPDGKYAVSADWNKCILWEIASGFSIAQYNRSHTNASDITFSNNGEQLLICDNNNLSIYDVKTGLIKKNYSISLLVAAYFLDSVNQVLIVTNDKLMIADIEKGKVLNKAEIGYRYLMPFNRLFLSKDKKYLFIDGKYAVSSINIYTGKEIFYNSNLIPQQNHNVFAEDGKGMVAVSSGLGETHVFNRETGDEITMLDLPVGTMLSVNGDTLYAVNEPGDHYHLEAENMEFLPGNKLMVHKLGDLQVWDIGERKMILSFPSSYYKDHIVMDSNRIMFIRRDSCMLYDFGNNTVVYQKAFASNIYFSNVSGEFGKYYRYNMPNHLLLAVDTSVLMPMVLNLDNNTVKKLNTKGVSDLKSVILVPSTEGPRIYCGYEDFCVGWDLVNAKNIFGSTHAAAYGEYKSSTALGSTVSVSPSGKWLVAEFNDYFNLFNFNTTSTCTIFDLPDHKKKYEIGDIGEFCISDNDIMLYQEYGKGHLNIKLLDLITGKTTLISKDTLKAKVISISSSGNYVAFFRDQHLYVYDRKKNKLTRGDEFINWRDDIDKIEFSADEKYLMVLGFEAVEIPVYNTTTGRKIITLAPSVKEEQGRMYSWATFDPASTEVWAKMSGTMYKFNIANGKSTQFEFYLKPISKIIDKTFWALQDRGDTLLRCRFNKKDSIDILRRIDLPGKNITINGDDLVFNNDKGAMWYKITPADTLQFMAEVYTLDEKNGMYLTKPWYKADKRASEVLRFLQKEKILSFEQLDLEYNRPDKVLQSTGSTDTVRINSYKRAYYKRLQRLGIDTARFSNGYSVPLCSIVNKADIPFEQSNERITIQVHAMDSAVINRFNVWVNEVPVFKAKGVAVKPGNIFDTVITIQLSAGDNRIETSVINVQGIESYREPMFVHYTPMQATKERLYFIGIGIDHFADSSRNLTWSVKDIRDLAGRIRLKYADAVIDTLFDKNVTKENILALKNKLQQLQVDDKVIVSYSGHGLLSKDLDYYLSTYNIDFNKPETNGLAYEQLEELLDGIPPRKKLVLIDACHSGELDKEEIAKIEASKTTLDSNGVKTKSTIKVVSKKKVGMTSSFELMQNLFVNVGRGTGATIISAAGGMQYAQERGDLKNGVFTFSILNAFNHHQTLSVSQLKSIVEETVPRLTNGLQKPTSRTGTNMYDWVVW